MMPTMRVRLLISILLLLQPRPMNSELELENLEMMVDKLSAMIDPSLTVAEKMGLFKRNIGPFLSLTGAAAPLIVSVASMALDAQSPESRAIAKLHEATTQGFASVTEQNAQLRKSIPMMMMSYGYNEHVALAIKRINKNPPKYLSGFTTNVCNDATLNPQKALDWLETVIVDNCALPKANTWALLARADSFFDRVEQSFTAEYWRSADQEEYQLGRSLAINGLLQLAEHDVASAIKLMDRLEEEANRSNGTAIEEAFLQLVEPVLERAADKPADANLCLLRINFDQHNHQRKHLRDVARMVLNDVILLEYAAALCAHFTNANNPKENVRQRNQARDTGLRITNHTEQWMDRAFEYTWPFLMQNVAKQAIGSANIPRDPTAYSAAVKKIEQAVNECGDEMYGIQVMVSEEMVGNGNDYHADCPDAISRCTVIRGHNKVDISLLRFPVSGMKERAEQATTWYTTHSAKAQASLSAAYSDDGYWAAGIKAHYFDSMLKNIERNVPGLRQPSLFKSRIILHMNTWSAHLPRPMYAISEGKFGGKSGNYLVSIHATSPITKKAWVLLFLFL